MERGKLFSENLKSHYTIVDNEAHFPITTLAHFYDLRDKYVDS